MRMTLILPALLLGACQQGVGTCPIVPVYTTAQEQAVESELAGKTMPMTRMFLRGYAGMRDASRRCWKGVSQ